MTLSQRRNPQRPLPSENVFLPRPPLTCPYPAKSWAIFKVYPRSALLTPAFVATLFRREQAPLQTSSSPRDMGGFKLRLV